MKNKLQPLGDITDELEVILQKMVYGHKLQEHEIIGIIHQYLQLHCYNEAVEHFTDGTKPVLYYGHKEGIEKK